MDANLLQDSRLPKELYKASDNHQPEIQTAAVVVTFSRVAEDTLLDLPSHVSGHRF